MKNTEQSLSTKISAVSLLGSLTLLIFAVISSFSSLIISFVIVQFGFKDKILNQSGNQNLVIIILLTMITMALSLFYAKKWLEPRIEEVRESVGTNMLNILSVILSIVLLLMFYFGYANFLSFLFNRFWV